MYVYIFRCHMHFMASDIHVVSYVNVGMASKQVNDIGKGDFGS